jgi:hypothetical protein
MRKNRSTLRCFWYWPSPQKPKSWLSKELQPVVWKIMRSDPARGNSSLRNLSISVSTVVLLICLFSPVTSLYPLSAYEMPSGDDQPKEDANSLVRDILRHEVDAEQHDKALWSYRELKVEDGKQKLYCVYQTKDGEIDRLVAVNSQPLNQQQSQAEDTRITKLIHHPGEMMQQKRKESEDGDRARNLLKMFPDAFRFQYESRSANLVKLRFTPNPKFHAEGHAAQVFHHLEGVIVLDPVHKRLISIDGKLMSRVEFGWGVLGHLDAGGVFNVEQREVSPGYWEVTRTKVNMKGKALFFKTIGTYENETYSDFRRVPDGTSLQQAAESVRHSAQGAQGS